MKNSGLSTGLFRDNTRRGGRGGGGKHKRKTKQCVWFTVECEKKRKAFFFFRAKNQHMHLKNAHTTEIRAQTNREYKKEVNSFGNIIQT